MLEGKKSIKKVGYFEAPLAGKGALGFHALILELLVSLGVVLS